MLHWGGEQLNTQRLFFSSVICVFLGSIPLIAQETGIDTSAFGAPIGGGSIESTAPADQDPESLIIIADQSPEERAQAPAVSTWDFVKMLLVLAAVIGAIYLLFYFLKKGGRKRHPEKNLIRMVDYQSLAGNRSLYLVMVGGNIYLVGSSENGVNLVSEITDEETQDRIRLEVAEESTTGTQSFSEMLKSVFRPARNVSMDENLHFMQKQKDRLKELQG